MHYTETGFEIRLTGDTLSFSGDLEKSDYTEVDAFLKKVDQVLMSDTCKIKLDKLKFLNSSGIRSLATFVLGTSKKIEIYINNGVTWQKESIPTLAYLKPDRIKIVS